MQKTKAALAMAMAMLLTATLAALGGVTALQNGVAPTAGYAGCKDTCISGEQWEGGNMGGSPTFAIGRNRAILIRFDLAPIPKDDVIHKAVLRLADVGMPRPGKDGTYPPVMQAYRLTHDWTESAGWKEFDRPLAAKGEAKSNTAWAAVGGDFDGETNFGQASNGLIAADITLVGAFGHMHELDVTPIVKAWQEGKYPNHGLLIKGAAVASAASSEWYVPTYRPALIVDHGAKGSHAAGIPGLPGVTPAKIELDSVSAAADAGTAKGEYVTVRIGQNETAALRGKSTDAYVKEAVLKYPGNWGWALHCGVGGVAGDFSRTLLYFDLSALPKDASIKSARLRVFFCRPGREPAGGRFGVYQVKLPDNPGWTDTEVTLDEARQGVPWPKGGLLAASAVNPVAIGTNLIGEADARGGKQKVAVGMEFDLTGLARAWASGKAPNCGVLLDNRIEGGAFFLHSSRSWQFDKRPYLELSLSPGVDAKPAAIAEKPSAPTGDYWLAAMREVHKRFKGKPGTFSQYGDSITITGAYLENFGWGGKITTLVKNMTPEVKAEMEAVENYLNLKLFHTWKGPGYGNDGSTVSAWLLSRVDHWQQIMDAEAATIMFGTNDMNGWNGPSYCENMAASCLRMMRDGTIPMLNSPPPKSGHEKEAYDAWLQVCNICKGLKIPILDYYGETIRRRPDDWNGSLPQFKEKYGKDVYAVDTIVSGDGTHPSNAPKYVNDFSEEGLNHNGYTLRNYTTLRLYYQLLSKVFLPEGKPADQPKAEQPKTEQK